MSKLVVAAFLLLCCAPAFISATTLLYPLRCQYDNGTFLTTATVCGDTLSDCEAIFGSPINNSRSELCNVADMQTLAMQCARTCAICCETPAYDCEDSGTTVGLNCTANKLLCTNNNWTSVMAQYCPQTCGLCASSNVTCRDINSNCNAMQTLCQNVNWYTYMEANCARTCGSCSTSSSCSDVASNCASITSLCTNSVYLSLMQQDCKKTCGYCTSSGGSGSTCTDSSSSCSTWVANGFCSNSFYTTAVKQQYCASSCGLC